VRDGHKLDVTVGEPMGFSATLGCMLLFLLAGSASSAAQELVVQRLSWAGLKLQSGDTTILIDPIDSDLWGGEHSQPVFPIEVDTARRSILLTHLHNDHYDRPTIARVIGEKGRVVVPADWAAGVASDGFRVRSVELYEPTSIGPFQVIAVPAVDGFGDEQVSWVILVEGRRIFHGGDTLWHGYWWKIGDTYGPFDVAFLPMNGVRGYWLKPASELPATLTPEQAVAAAVVLRARQLTPIHWGHTSPGMYVEQEGALEALLETAQKRHIHVQTLMPGEQATLPPSQASQQ